MEPNKKLVIEFANEEARYHFVSWLCGSGEQDYWTWMEYCEEGAGGPITVTKFNYHKNGKFNAEHITTECGRLGKEE